jgi:hypothetical protein
MNEQEEAERKLVAHMVRYMMAWPTGPDRIGQLVKRALRQRAGIRRNDVEKAAIMHKEEGP